MIATLIETPQAELNIDDTIMVDHLEIRLSNQLGGIRVLLLIYNRIPYSYWQEDCNQGGAWFVIDACKA
jgi:hypothetical protein